MTKTILHAALFAASLAGLAVAPGRVVIGAAPTAEVQRDVHPVLIRNERNALLRVVIHSDRADVRVTSFRFGLAGTDDRHDIEALELYTSDGDGSLATASRFAAPLGPDDPLAFYGDRQLALGPNVFWLSCRLRTSADLGHRVGAVCLGIETSAGALTPHDEAASAAKRIGIALRKHLDEGVHTYRIPALATTTRGTLLCVYDMRRRQSRDLQEDIDIGLSRSTDGGQTWEAARVIMDMGRYGGLPQEQNGCSDPGIIIDPKTGHIFVAAVWMWGKPGQHQWDEGGSEPGFEIGKSAQFLLVHSEDDGLTWSQPVNLTRQLKREDWILFAPSPQQGIALADGTLVWPSQGRDAQDQHFSTIMTSRDQGATWSVGSPAAVGNTECQAVELSDGTIMLNARSEQPVKFRSVYTTSDLGSTWTPHPTHRQTLIEPNCNGSIYRFDYDLEGKKRPILLFANPRSQQAREQHTLQISLDDGLTWPANYHLLLDAGRGRGYPSLTRIGDRHIGIVYEGSQADLVFEKISIDELLRPD